MPHPDPIEESRLTRPAFLRASAFAVAGLALGGFPASAARKSELDAFVALSELVTGAAPLPRGLASRYLAALQEAPLAMPPSRFLTLSGFADGRGPATLAALRQAPSFRMTGGRAPARAVAAAWWSGMVPAAEGGSRVVAYYEALVWQALPYAQPPSACLGAPGAWTEAAS